MTTLIEDKDRELCDTCIDNAIAFKDGVDGLELQPTPHECDYYIRHADGRVSVMGGICDCPCNEEFKTLRA